MNKEDLILQKDYSINSLLINSNRQLGLYGLLGLLQDISYDHASLLGYGYEDMIRDNTFWVLIRQKLRMTYWPKWKETVAIKTYPKPGEGCFADRNFVIYHDGEKIGECATSWMILDAKTRRPHFHHGFNERYDPGEEYYLPFTTDKLKNPKGLELVKSITVKNSDLDLSKHVNNFKYSQWVLDLIPIEYHSLYSVVEYDINFLGEAFINDKVDCFSNLNQMSPEFKNEIYFYGVKNSNQKPIFSVRVIAEKVG